jgi:hypothetical protein
MTEELGWQGSVRRLRDVPRAASRRALALAALLAAQGCDDSGPRVYTARLYRPGAVCLEPYRAIGLLLEAGRLASACAPVCLAVGTDLYVSSVCAPYPDQASVVNPETSPVCRAALAALAAAECYARAGERDAG